MAAIYSRDSDRYVTHRIARLKSAIHRDESHLKQLGPTGIELTLLIRRLERNRKLLEELTNKKTSAKPTSVGKPTRKGAA